MELIKNYRFLSPGLSENIVKVYKILFNLLKGVIFILHGVMWVL
jgi:hypothetical protein